jgi:hypothetical protein
MASFRHAPTGNPEDAGLFFLSRKLPFFARKRQHSTNPGRETIKYKDPIIT